jgi:hypothetical protein
MLTEASPRCDKPRAPLTDLRIRNLKPREKAYKIADRDRLYVVVTPAGLVSFRYDYRVNVAARRW